LIKAGLTLNSCQIMVAGLVLPPAEDGWLMLAVDVSPQLRSDARMSPFHPLYSVYGRSRDTDRFIPSRPYSFVAAPEPGRTSWKAILDAVRLGPDDDAVEVTAVQVRAVIERLITAGQRRDGDPNVLVEFGADKDLAQLAFLFEDLPVEVVGRIRADRVLRMAAPLSGPDSLGRQPEHGRKFRLADPGTWFDPAAIKTTDTTRFPSRESTRARSARAADSPVGTSTGSPRCTTCEAFGRGFMPA
jgi:hypothetical protein